MMHSTSQSSRPNGLKQGIEGEEEEDITFAAHRATYADINWHHIDTLVGAKTRLFKKIWVHCGGLKFGLSARLSR